MFLLRCQLGAEDRVEELDRVVVLTIDQPSSGIPGGCHVTMSSVNRLTHPQLTRFPLARTRKKRRILSIVSNGHRALTAERHGPPHERRGGARTPALSGRGGRDVIFERPRSFTANERAAGCHVAPIWCRALQGDCEQTARRCPRMQFPKCPEGSDRPCRSL